MQKDNYVLTYSSLYSGQKGTHLDATGSFSLVKPWCERISDVFPKHIKGCKLQGGFKLLQRKAS